MWLPMKPAEPVTRTCTWAYLATKYLARGWWQISADVEGQVALVIDLAGTAALVLWTRGKVTPVDEPRAADGTPLVPADRSLYQGGDYTGRHRDPDQPTQYDRLHDGEEG